MRREQIAENVSNKGIMDLKTPATPAVGTPMDFVIEIKEVKFRPNIDIHDYEVKMRNVTRFLEDGDKVKVTLRFRGREMAHQELGREVLERIAADTVELGKVESMPKMEGRQMIMVIGPKA